MPCVVKRQVFVDSCFLGYLPYLVVHVLSPVLVMNDNWENTTKQVNIEVKLT